MGKKCHGCTIMENYEYWSESSATRKQFFKIMVYDFEQRLRIPKKFTECFKQKLGPWCTLIGASQNNWRVKLSRSTAEDEQESSSSSSVVVVDDGWEQYVNDNGVELYDFLVFRYVGDSSFEVSVFDKSGCEREGTHFANNNAASSSSTPRTTTTTCNSILHSSNSASSSNNDSEDSLVEVESEADTDVDSSWDEGDDKSEDCEMEEKTGNSSNQGKIFQVQKCFISNRRKVTEAEKQRASKMAAKYVSKMQRVPVFQITLLPTHVYHGFHLTIPKVWAMKHMRKESHEIELQVPKAEAGKSWIVGCRWTRMQQCQVRAKWPMFVLDNNLEEHDVCVFELIRKSTTPVFNVRIFRAVDHIVPLSLSTRLV